MDFFKNNWQLIKSGNLELKDFALVMGFVLVLFGLVGNHIKIEFALDNLLLWGLFVLVCGIFKPDLLVWFQKAWMMFGVTMGFIMSHVILLVVFIFVFLPIGILLKFVMNKKLFEEVDSSKKSYWTVRKEPARTKLYYQRQF